MLLVITACLSFGMTGLELSPFMHVLDELLNVVLCCLQ